MTDYGSPLFAALRSAEAPAWSAYVNHRFVRDLGAGTLAQDAFHRYLTQDYVFLVHFARAWAMAVVKSDRIAEMRQAAATVHALIDVEMRLHVEMCAAQGVSEAALARTEEAPETLAYTRFVIDAGLSGDLLDLLVALSPCVFGYGEIGARLAHEAASSNPYAPWIESYAGEDYQQVCREAGALLEAVADRRIGPAPTGSPRWSDLATTFRTACRLETDFWAMGLGGRQP